MLLQGDDPYANFSDPANLAREIRNEVAAKNIVASFSDGSRLYTHAGLRSAIRIAVQNEVGVKTAASCSTRGGLKKLSDRLNSIFISSLKAGDLESHPIFHVDRERGGRHEIGGIFRATVPSSQLQNMPTTSRRYLAIRLRGSAASNIAAVSS
jgi:hypothetical protein